MAQDIGATGAQFSIGRVISTSLAVFGRNLVPFLVLAFIIGIPYLVVTFMAASSLDLAVIEQTGQLPPGFWGMILVSSIIFMLTYSLTQATIIYGTVQDLRGQRAPLGDCIARGFSSMGRVLIAALLASIAIGIGMMLLVVPGLFLLLIWWVLTPVLVVENAGIGQAFSRSRELTRGHRWKILAILLIVGVAQWLVGLVLGLAGAALGTMAAQVLNAVVLLFFSAFACVLAAVGYYLLRAEKEGIVIDDLARVFD
jgi:hypothetical protein